MTQWHAEIDRSVLAAGVRLTVMSEHHVVRVITADTLSIEIPGGQRLSAVVLDRTGGDIKLVQDNGQTFCLEMMLDESLHHGASPEIFSRQVWLTH